MTIYQKLASIGATIENYHSDLYVLATPETLELTADEPNRKFFMSDVDKKLWIELPYRFDPYWERGI